MAFTKRTIEQVAAATGHSAGGFAFVRHMMGGLRKIDRHGTEYLLGGGEKARYRFCAACLAATSAKFFPLHWRFKCWRWCPVHRCLLQDGCPHCGSYIYLPGNMLSAGPDKAGVGVLERCLECGEYLSSGWHATLDSLDSSLVVPWEQALLTNGRAVLSAIYHGHFFVGEQRTPFTIHGIKRLHKQGLLPHDHFVLTHGEMMRRRAKQAELLAARP